MSEFDVEATVRRLRDESDIARLALRYATGLDRREFDDVFACFDPEGYMVGTVGEGRVTDYLPLLIERVRSFGATQHLIANSLIAIAGDEATAETYAVARHFADAAGTIELLVVGVRYEDTSRRQPCGDWLITNRRVVTMWERRTDRRGTE